MAQRMKLGERDALLVIDVQNDFCPGGALAVEDGDRVVPVANRLAERFPHVIFTQDWHPQGHSSFASSHPGKKPFETIRADYGEQVLWPDHCIPGTKGAEFHPDLDRRHAELIVRKGYRPSVDSYSALYENDHETPTGLAGLLRERGLERLFLVGLATDFCVQYTALDASRAGFDVFVVEDGVRAIDIDGSEDRAWRSMVDSGVERIHSRHLAAEPTS